MFQDGDRVKLAEPWILYQVMLWKLNKRETAIKRAQRGTVSLARGGEVKGCQIEVKWDGNNEMRWEFPKHLQPAED
jgi:hypothetical protein